jgi:arginyl-tRNA synthetase
MARKEIAEKGREGEVDDVEGTAFAVALGALNYFLYRRHRRRIIIFNPKESISFNGNTGPYLLYMGARISSMLRKYEERKRGYQKGTFNGDSFRTQEEREIVKSLSPFRGGPGRGLTDFDLQ